MNLDCEHFQLYKLPRESMEVLEIGFFFKTVLRNTKTKYLKGTYTDEKRTNIS